MRSSIRVLVVDDSALIRQMLTRALSMDPRIDVVGTAKTGFEAVEQSRLLDPDVVTLDIEMPELTGLEALPHIRRYSDARIVVLSCVDDPDTTYRALELGAVDFIPKPSAGMASSITELSDLLLKKIKTAYRVVPGKIEQLAVDRIPGRPPSDVGTGGPRARGSLTACVAMAASTGGPPALERVFSGLSASLPASYVLVQHLPAGFSASFARRLSTVGDIRVVEAERGMPIEQGRAYVAPHGVHMLVRRSDAGEAHVEFTSEPPLHGVRPSADFLLESVAEEYGENAIGVVLTGMGSDGARGAASIKAAGGDTIVQDEATSVVWGMPGATVKLAGAGHVVPTGLIAAEIRRAIRSRIEVSA